MKNLFGIIITIFLINICSFSLFAQNDIVNKITIDKTNQLMLEIAKKSFPEIKLKKIKVKTFQSKTSFFKARFSLTRYLTFQKMRHLVFVNPRLFSLEPPEEGIRAILAHELAHVLYYTEKNRFQLLGLSGLVSSSFIASFERKADLTAIERGFGPGLIKYRQWLYENISKEEVISKKKNYFSPEEIELMLNIIRENPEIIKIWRKKVPKNIYEIKNGDT
jgi:hypothetical protein